MYCLYIFDQGKSYPEKELEVVDLKVDPQKLIDIRRSILFLFLFSVPAFFTPCSFVPHFPVLHF